jgi:hypothetical protein
MSDDETKQTREQIAVAAYETFMAMMGMLQQRIDHSEAKNYVSVNIDGMLAPFDRAQLHFVREGGKSPLEVIDDLRGVATQALDLLEDIAAEIVAVERGMVPRQGEGDKIRAFVDAMRRKVPPKPWVGR